MKEKIASAFRTKHQRFGLSNEAVDRIASALEKTVANEEDIETAIASAETMGLIANELQKSADRERRSRSDLQKSFDDYKKSHPETEPEPTPVKQEEAEPEWARKLREQNAALVIRLDQQDRERKDRATLESVKASAQKAGCTDERVFKLTERLFTLKEGESDADAAVRFEEEYNANMKEYFGGSGAPGAPTGNGFSGDDDFHKAMKAYAETKFQGEGKE